MKITIQIDAKRRVTIQAATGGRPVRYKQESFVTRQGWIPADGEDWRAFLGEATRVIDQAKQAMSS